jgi:hypothetical protein
MSEDVHKSRDVVEDLVWIAGERAGHCFREHTFRSLIVRLALYSVYELAGIAQLRGGMDDQAWPTIRDR